MEFKSIEAFLKIVEKGSFTLAADEMFISQPTISSRIQKLEQQLNTVLFVRNGGKKAILTPEGEKIYPYYKEGYRNILKGNEILQINKKGFGKIQLSCPNHMGQLLLPRVLKSLYENFPDNEFNVKVSPTFEILKDIKSGETDVGLIYRFDEEKNDSYTIIQLAMEKIVLVASPNHPLAKRGPLDIMDLQNEKFIVYSKDAINIKKIFKFLLDNGLEKYNIIEIRNLEWLKDMVKNGIGISFPEKHNVQEELKKHELVELLLSKPLPTTPISIIFRHAVPEEIRYTISKTVRDLLHA